MKPKICFAASSGGHFEQLMQLRPLMEKYDSFVLTEKTEYNSFPKNIKCYDVPQVNRNEADHWLKLIGISFKSMYIYAKEKPDIVITTGVLATIPFSLIAKLFHKKLIYIESFAKVNSPTKTGKFMYKKADRFYVQWPQMKEFYPDAIYIGGIY